MINLKGKETVYTVKIRFYYNTVKISRLKFSSLCPQKYLDYTSDFIFIRT